MTKSNNIMIIKKSIAFLGTLLMFSSCSLLNVSIDTGVEPFAKKDLNTRLAVRSFAEDFKTQIISTADSIEANTEVLNEKQAAIQWKINSTSLVTRTAYQSIPEISLLETWVLTQAMVDFFNDSIADCYFGESTNLAQNVSVQQLANISQVASNIYSRKAYMERQVFVEEYAATHPFTSLDFSLGTVMEDFTSFLGIADTAYVQTIGSAAEVMSDMSERLTVLSAQTQVQIEWQKDLFSINNNTDSIASTVMAHMDSLAVFAEQMSNLAQSSPELMHDFLIQFQTIVSPMLQSMNTGMQQSFDELSQEREMFQLFVDQQRALAINEIATTGDQLIATTIDHVTLMLKQLSWLIIILAIVLTLVLFGLPFFLGYQFAKLKGKISKNK